MLAKVEKRVVDERQMRQFVSTIFANCGDVDGWLSLRAFEHADGGRLVEKEWVRLSNDPAGHAAHMAQRIADRDYDRRAVFCPPVCLFGDEIRNDQRTAAASNVVCGPAIAVELDANPQQALATLVRVLGEPTIVVRSGGIWKPDDGKPEDKLHAYWRLHSPAVQPAALLDLRQARELAARLVRADTTAAPLPHPMRWPGSWHTKEKTARLCEIVSIGSARGIYLPMAIDSLETACAAAGLNAETSGRPTAARRRGFKTKQPWTLDQMIEVADLISNENVEWDQWNTVGMAFWDASHAGHEGLEAFHRWSAKDEERYDSDETDRRWDHWSRHPPSDVSGGSLIFLARQQKPEYATKLKSPFPEDFFDLSASVGAAAPGAAAPGGTAADLVETTAKTLPAYVKRLNEKHAFVMNGGRSVVATIADGQQTDFMQKSAFFDRYANETMVVGTAERPKEVSIAMAWWVHPGRRQYLNGIDFDPNGVAPGIFNLWRGFAPSPQLEIAPEDGCPLILRHIREVICAGDSDHAEYLLGWLAHIVQRPAEKPGVAIVLKGGKGTGKDTLGAVMDRILGAYYVMVSAQEQVTGRFNGHLSGKLLLHVEEALWAGDKAGESVLKSLITAPRMTIERKGLDSSMEKSFVRVFMTSNENWVVPASSDERRFFVLDVSEAHRHEAAWFDPLRRELEGIGPAAFRRFLEQFPLKAFDVRRPPHTQALARQQQESLRGFDRWWFETISDGHAFGDAWETEGVDVPVGQFRRLYLDWQTSRRFEQPIADHLIGQKLREFLPGCTDIRRRPRTEFGREWVYRLPPASECRRLWDSRHPHPQPNEEDTPDA